MKVTLSDIAGRAEVAISTVQRALDGSPGVSEKKRREIQQIADEMGYTRNIFASSLKRGAFRIAIAYPDKSGYNRFYSNGLWAGIDEYMREAASTGIEPVKILYGDSQQAALQTILAGEYGKIDGVVTRGTSSKEVLEILERFQAAGIPVVLTGTDIPRPALRLSCVKGYEEMAGRMAADLFLRFSCFPCGSRVVLCGDFSGSNQFNNALGFEKHIWNTQPDINIVKLSGGIDTAPFNEALQAVVREKEPVGLYACSARHTVAACEVLDTLGLRNTVQLIGSDIFPESVQFMREGRLQALLHSQPQRMAAVSMETLAAHLQKTVVETQREINISAIIVTPGNLDFYLDEAMENS